MAETPILGPPDTVAEQGRVWAKGRRATDEFVALADIYWDIAPTLDVRPEVAYAQAAKETGFGRFGGVLTPSYHNPAGLKTSQGGSNSDPKAHQRFPDWETGVLAHVQHLALYAGKVVTGKIVDPRHFLYLRGRASTVEQLGGKWAPNPEYGISIVKDFLKPLLATPKPELSWKEKGIKRLEEAGLINGRHLSDDNVKWGELAAVTARLLDRLRLG